MTNERVGYSVEDDRAVISAGDPLYVQAGEHFMLEHGAICTGYVSSSIAAPA